MSETLIVDSVDQLGAKIDRTELQRTIQAHPKLEQSISVDDVVKKSENGSDGIRFGKRRKTRRGKPKRRKLKPYSRLWQEDKQNKPVNARAKYAYGQPEAPYNTTQFLIADHNDLQGLDDQLLAVTKNSEGVNEVQRPARARDSSFSVDSDEDYFYSSPEDEGDFLSKEFSNTYEDLHAERISAMSKTQLIQEYLMLEEKVGLLEARLKTAETKLLAEDLNSKTVAAVPEDFNVPETLMVYKQEIEKLHVENEQLRRENDSLRCTYMKEKSPSVSSVDSESDSSSSTSGSSSDSWSSDMEEEEDAAAAVAGGDDGGGGQCASPSAVAEGENSISEDADAPASADCAEELK